MSHLAKPITLSHKLRTDVQNSAKSSHARRYAGDGGNELPNINFSKSMNSLDMKRAVTASTTTVSKRNVFQRLSGLPDFIDCAGIMPENLTTTKPSSLCVRCSNHASMCMPCTELLCEQSLNFYRVSRARGAAALFSSAITDAGMAKLSKFILFRLWKNFHMQYKRLHHKKRTVVERMFGSTLAVLPFKAWQRYTRETKLQRKDEKINELEEKLRILEQQVLKLSSENRTFARQIEESKIEVEKLTSTVDHQRSEIEQQHKALCLERSRVVGLASLTEPIHVMLSLIESMQSKILSDMRHALLDGNVVAHDYASLYKNSPLELYETCGAKAHRNSRSYKPSNERAYITGELFPDVDTTVELMLTWLQAKSYEAGTYFEPISGDPVEVFLPKHAAGDIKDPNELGNGHTLMRAVVALIYDAASAHTYHHPDGPPPKKLELHDLEKIQAGSKDASRLLHLVLQYSEEYLHMPRFKFKDILLGDADIILAFVSHLMLTAPPVRPHHGATIVSKLSSLFEEGSRACEEAKNRGMSAMSKLGRIQFAWAGIMSTPVVQHVVAPHKKRDNLDPVAFFEELHNTEVELEEENEFFGQNFGALDDDDDDDDVAFEKAQSKIKEKRAALKPDSATTNGKKGTVSSEALSQNNQSVKKKVLAVPVTSHVISESDSVYLELAVAVDSFLLMEDDLDTRSASPIFTDAVQQLGKEVLDLFDVDVILTEWERRKNTGMCLGTTVHRHVASRLITSMAKSMKWLNVDDGRPISREVTGERGDMVRRGDVEEVEVNLEDEDDPGAAKMNEAEELGKILARPKFRDRRPSVQQWDIKSPH